jgi:hypothetical protein
MIKEFVIFRSAGFVILQLDYFLRSAGFAILHAVMSS